MSKSVPKNLKFILLTTRNLPIIKKIRQPKLLLIGVLVIINLSLLASVLGGKDYIKVPFLVNSENDFSEIEELRGNTKNFGELSIYFTTLSEQKGADYALEILKVADVAPNIDMHLMAHVVGDILYRQKGIEGIKVCTRDFRNACSHSIVVGAFLESGESALPSISDACRQAPGGKGAYTMCFHGLGHGVLAFTGYDMEKAVGLCKKTASKENNDREYVECVGGVVMEMMSGVNDPKAWEKQKNNYFKKDDPFAPCSLDFIPKDAKTICYTYITPHLFEYVGGNLSNLNEEDFKATFKLCEKIPGESNLKDTCSESLGKEFVVLAPGRDIRRIEDLTDNQLEKIYDWCLLAGKEGVEPCISSALRSLYWGGENDKSVSIKFCTIISSKNYQRVCFEELIASVSNYKQDQAYYREFCDEVISLFTQDCKNKLRIN